MQVKNKHNIIPSFPSKKQQKTKNHWTWLQNSYTQQSYSYVDKKIWFDQKLKS